MSSTILPSSPYNQTYATLEANNNNTNTGYRRIDLQAFYDNRSLPPGREDVFVLVPNGTSQWTRQSLSTIGTGGLDGHGQYMPAEAYGFVDIPQSEVGDVSQNGIAFGVDTTGGTAWFQESGHNTPVNPAPNTGA
jgi:hypothetical protein